MPITELLFNVLLMLPCYNYVVAVILVSSRFEEVAMLHGRLLASFCTL